MVIGIYRIEISRKGHIPALDIPLRTEGVCKSGGAIQREIQWRKGDDRERADASKLALLVRRSEEKTRSRNVLGFWEKWGRGNEMHKWGPAVRVNE